MAGILTLTNALSLDVLRTHLRFATARLKSDPNATQYVIATDPGCIATDPG